MEEKVCLDSINRKRELFILVAYSFHIVCMTIGVLHFNWDRLIVYFNIFVVVSNVIIYATNRWDVKGRALYISVLVECCVVIYAFNIDNYLLIALPFVGIVFFMSLYTIPDLLFLPIISFTIIVLYHYFVKKTIILNSFTDYYYNFTSIINMYVIIIYVWKDIINRIKNKKEVDDAIKELKKAEHSKDDFLANVSHEIRTPINTISGMSEVILHDELSPDLKEKIEDIQTSGRKLLTVVNDLLDFSELNSGKQTITEVSYNLASTINDVINLANAWKSNKNIELVVDCDATIPRELVGDEQKIRRLILNFLSNAIKFTNDGCITITFTYREEYYGINLCVSVKDTGIGLDDTSREKLFTSFNQVDTKRNRQEGGIGLGLAISKKIVEQMGGFINVKSELGKGSEFQFVIPQKVQDKAPLIELENLNRVNVLLYINMEQFDMIAIRDAYLNNISHMAEQLNVRFHRCRNLAEFQRRVEREYFSDLFISWESYCEDKEYFDELSQKHKLIIVIDKAREKELKNDSLIRLYKPFYILPIVSIIKGVAISKEYSGKNISIGHFIAPNANVMIVDDNYLNLKVASSLLKTYKMNISTALSGAEVLEKIESKKYDIIFMDHMMPEMDGVETLHRIRKKNELYYREVPIIALTANAVAGAREMFLKEGFQEFVAKPIEISVLDRVLREFLPEDKLIPIDKPVEEPDDKAEEETVIEENPKDKEKNVDIDVELDFEDLQIDIKQGITYCGTKEDYIDILRLQYEDSQENRNKIIDFYNKEDWDNYVIFVHGIKSSMKSIGINKLSDMCKELEYAGKEKRIDFIKENHDKMIQEYDKVMDVLGHNFSINEQMEDDVSDLEELAPEEFERYIDEFENAVYTWEDENMLSILKELTKYKYKEKRISSLLEPIYKKVDMSDYMSAYEALKRIKIKVDGK